MLEYSLHYTLEQALTVYLKGDLDIDSTEVIEEKLLPQLLDCREVYLDFKEVPFVDSSGMGLLLTIVQSLHEKGAVVKITSLTEDVQVVFDLLQIPEILGESVFS